MHSDKWAPAAGLVVALCLLDVGPVIGIVSALGLGFLLDPWVLLPLYLALMGVTLWTLAVDRRYHGSPVPSWLAWGAGVLVPAGYWTLGVLGWAGMIALAAAGIRNQILVGRLTGRPARAREAARKLG